MSQAKKILESLYTLEKSAEQLAPQHKHWLEEFKKIGFEVKVESSSLGNNSTGIKGTLHTQGTNGAVVNFHIGAENLYITIPEMHIKSGHGDVAKALATYLKIAGNHSV